MILGCFRWFIWHISGRIDWKKPKTRLLRNIVRWRHSRLFIIIMHFINYSWSMSHFNSCTSTIKSILFIGPFKIFFNKLTHFILASPRKEESIFFHIDTRFQRKSHLRVMILMILVIFHIILFDLFLLKHFHVNDAQKNVFQRVTWKNMSESTTKFSAPSKVAPTFFGVLMVLRINLYRLC